MKNDITKYIQFAIENEFKLKGLEGSHKNEILKNMLIQSNIELSGELDLGINYDNKVEGIFIYEGYMNTYYNLIETITSKPFIEAIARGFSKINHGNDIGWLKYRNKITTDQAIHIREGTLDLFIKELLKNYENNKPRIK